MNLFTHIKELLSKNEKFCKDNELFKNNVVEAALKLDTDLIKLLLTDNKAKETFFIDIEGVMVFDKVKFQKFVSNKQFLPDSYTAFKNKIGLTEAFADRKDKGYTWNNLMLSKWVDHEGKEHRVMEDYERNKSLVDLHAQPEVIIQELDQTIDQAIADNKSIDQVGIRFMKFCGKYDLQKISEQAQLYVEPFNARLVA